MHTKWLFIVLLTIPGLTSTNAQELKRGDFVSRNEQQQQNYQKERLQLQLVLLLPTLRQQLEKKDYQAINWIEESIIDQTAHLNEMELLRQQMVR